MTHGVHAVYELASHLRDRYGHASDRVTFTHIPTVMEPRAVLDLLRGSALRDLVRDDGMLLTHPERPWYGPVEAIRADLDQLTAVGVTASTWDDHPSQPRGRAAELVIRLIFGVEPKAQQEFMLRSSDSARPVLARAFYDCQRAETGYEGDDQVTLEPTEAQIADFIAIVRAATGA